MKCKHCDGTGKSNMYKDGAFVDCMYCGGTGEYEPFDADVELDKLYPTEQTNEEWFCGLSTKEKAKEIYKIAKDDFKELRKLFYGVANDDCDALALWLKQPHKE